LLLERKTTDLITAPARIELVSRNLTQSREDAEIRKEFLNEARL
jgi:hypothetical protein